MLYSKLKLYLEYFNRMHNKSKEFPWCGNDMRMQLVRESLATMVKLLYVTNFNWWRIKRLIGICWNKVIRRRGG